jgi:CheY-like chemotaxis protein
MAIAATDNDLRITYYNPAAEELFELKANEVIGKTVQETHSKKNISPSIFAQAMETVKKEGEYKNIVKMKTNGDARTKDIRLLEMGFLQGLDVDFLEAGNGEEALALLENNNPHLIILDIFMPFMDGLQVLEAMRKNQGAQSIPIIIVTTGTDRETRDKAFAMGANDYVTKPFEAHDLVSRVSKFVG